jgi:uncharacterized protein
MDVSFMVLFFLLGAIGSFLSGMLGIGGAIVQYPVLLYLPPLFGFPAFSAHDVTGMVAVQVFFTSMAGLVVHGKGGSFNQSLAVYMGTAVLAGSFLGGYGSKWLSETWIHFIYAILATLAVWMMFHSEKETKETAARPIVSHPATVMGIALVVGVFSGIIGSSGSFILVPVLLFVFKIPTRTAIATSLAIAFVSSAGSVAAKLVSDQILLLPSMILAISGLIASPAGAMVSKKTNPRTLRVGLTLVIAITFLKIWYDYLAIYIG